MATTLVLGACVKTTSTSFVRGANSAVEYAYVNEKADFSRYTALTTDGLEIYFPSNIDAPAPDDLERIRASFRTAFRSAIGDDFAIVEEPGPDVLKIRAQLVDMKITGAKGDFTGGGRLEHLVTRGELTFIMEMIDSVSGEVLARAGDRTHTSGNRAGKGSWAEVDEAAEHWAALFRAWLDRTIAKT
jgi:hypothetical protein